MGIRDYCLRPGCTKLPISERRVRTIYARSTTTRAFRLIGWLCLHCLHCTLLSRESIMEQVDS